MRRCAFGVSHLANTASWLSLAARHGRSQIDDVPTSTARKPRGPHRGPGKRQISEAETSAWLHWRKWELTMKAEWDELEPFRHLPKPKKQFGNEACEVIWPYALLMENKVAIHPFTKSVYVYYPQHALTAEGSFYANVARDFSRRYLVPICFHNNHVYVETEMLLQYGDRPWVVVHCLDGRHVVVPLEPTWLPVPPSGHSAAASTQEGKPNTNATSVTAARAFPPVSPHLVRSGVEALLKRVLADATTLGDTVADVGQVRKALHDRPLQNSFIRVDYQWFGTTPEARMTHLVQWMDVDAMKKQAAPMRRRVSRVVEGLNYADPTIPVSGTAYQSTKRSGVQPMSAAKFVSLGANRNSPMFAKRAASQAK